jgi:NAD(P)-dependent dehydrogenase (short-subunit alcohol dehydrogenase family)
MVEQRVAVVTGGGTGIGRASAERLARLGFAVQISGRRPEVLQQAAKEIRQAVPESSIVNRVADVSLPEDCEALIASANQ